MPIFLTFKHGRNCFRNKQFAPWVLNFKTAEFDGFEAGNYFPTLKINLEDFAANKCKVPDYVWANLVKIKGAPTLLEHLLGFRSFENERKEEIEETTKEAEEDPLPQVL